MGRKVIVEPTEDTYEVLQEIVAHLGIGPERMGEAIRVALSLLWTMICENDRDHSLKVDIGDETIELVLPEFTPHPGLQPPPCKVTKRVYLPDDKDIDEPGGNIVRLRVDCLPTDLQDSPEKEEVAAGSISSSHLPQPYPRLASGNSF